MESMVAPEDACAMPKPGPERIEAALGIIDDHPWLLPGTLTLASVALGLIFSLGAWGWPDQAPHWWFMPRDLWATWRNAQIVGSGHGASVYGGGTKLLALPGLAVLLAPLAYVADHFHLVGGWPVEPPHPRAWLILDPAALALGSSVLWPLDAFARKLGIGTARRLALGGVAAVVAWTVVAPMGHPEDLVAVAVALYAVLAGAEGDWDRAAWLMGGALAFQQVAVLALPVVVALGCRGAVRPWARVGAMAWRSSLLPGTLGLSCLLSEPAATWSHLVAGHTVTPWETPLAAFAPGGQAGPLRMVAVVGSIAIGFAVYRRDVTMADLPWWLGLSFATRLVEPLQCPYYLAPAALMFSLACATGRASRRATIVVGVAAMALGPATGTWQEHHPWRLWTVLVAVVWVMTLVSAPGMHKDGDRGDAAQGGADRGSEGFGGVAALA